MKRFYVAPSLKTLEVRFEKGFAASLNQLNSTEDVNETYSDWDE